MAPTSNLAGTEASTFPSHLQLEAFSQRSKDLWALEMASNRGDSRGSERTSRVQKNRYEGYILDPRDPLMPVKEVKKRAWVRDNFFMAGGHGGTLKRQGTIQFPEARTVLHEEELCEAIIATHLSLSHAGQEVTATAVVHDYFGITKKECISLLKHCAICSRGRPSKAKGPLKPIQSKRVFKRVQIDLIDMSSDADGDFLWICHMECHFSKFHGLFGMRNKESSTVARVVHRWICWLGVMEILQSDNGTEFKGVCEELLLRYGVKVINGRPRTPRTQGLVEQANGTVKQRIFAWKRQTGNSHWEEGLEEIGLSMNCTHTRSIGTTPYEIVFNRKPHYRRIPYYSRSGYEIEEEELSDHEADTALREKIQDAHNDIGDAEMIAMEQEARDRIAARRTERQDEDEAINRSKPDPPHSSWVPRIDRPVAGIGSEEERVFDCITDAQPRTEMASAIHEQARQFMRGALQDPYEEGHDFTNNSGDHRSTPPVWISSGSSSSSGSDSSEDESTSGKRAATGNADVKPQGRQVPETPQRDAQDRSTNRPGDILSPSMGALRLQVQELDGTPITAARIKALEYQKGAQARSIKAYGKQRRVQVYAVGQNVSVAIPREDRSSTDDKRLFGKVIGVFEEMNQYEILTQWGVLDRMCPINIVNPLEPGVDVALASPVPSKRVSLAFCAAQQSTSEKVQVKCNCKDRKTWCSKRTCRCIKAKVKCSVHCHESQGHPDTRIECPNVAPLHEFTRMGLGTREQQAEQRHVEKRQRQDAAGKWVSTKGIGYGPVDSEGNVDENVRKEHEGKKQRRR